MNTSHLGSVKNKIVATDLLKERSNCNFNSKELTEIIFENKEEYKLYKEWCRMIDEDPVLRNREEFYDMTREE
jgi:hypothetical protein